MAKQTRNPDRFAHLRGKVRWGRCDICGLEYPESQITKQEGYAVCVDDYEPMGLDNGRDRARREGTALAAQIAAGHKNPQFTSSDFITRAGVGVIVPFVRIIGISGFNQYLAIPAIIQIENEGASVACTGYGENLTSENVTSISASHSGIAVSGISFPSTSQVDFTLSAAGGPPDGYHSLTFTFAGFEASNLFRRRLYVYPAGGVPISSGGLEP